MTAATLSAVLVLVGAAIPRSFLPGSLQPAPALATVSAGYLSAGRAPVAPGVQHDWGTIETTRSGRQAVNLLEVKAGTPEISVESSLAGDRITSLETTTSQALRRSSEGHRAVAAINGDVWNGYGSPTAYAPNGIDIQAGELVTAARVARPTFGIDASGQPIIGNVLETATATLPIGTTIPIDHVNQGRGSGEVALYTPRFGPTTPGNVGGTDIVLGGVALPLTPTGVHQAVVRSVRAATGGVTIAPDTLVLNGPEGWPLDTLQPGDAVTLSLAITPGWENIRQAIGGREFIVRDGATSISPRPSIADQLHPRTALGITATGDLILATVDGRQPGYSTGVDLDELSQLMLSRGVVQALNMDGGGSTTMAVRLPGDQEVSVANRPSAGRQIAVANSLIVFSSAPTGPLATVAVVPAATTLLEGAVVDLVARGQDTAYNGVVIAAGEVTWTLNGPGSISPAGHFSSTAAGTVTVTATARGIVGTATITVVAPPPPPPPPPPLPPLAIGGTSALGLRPTTGFTTTTPKTQRIGASVTWRFSGGPALAGQRVNIMVATKVGGAWGSPRYAVSRVADARGTVTYWWTSSKAAAINVRVQWPGTATYGVSTSAARGAYWK